MMIQVGSNIIKDQETGLTVAAAVRGGAGRRKGEGEHVDLPLPLRGRPPF